MKTLLIIISFTSIGILGCTKQNETTNLSPAEKDNLIFLREEEKLARDVYLYAVEKYNSTIFSNISYSEQSHMDEVLVLLNRYDITDPAQNSAPGVFLNGTLQNLYNELTSKVDQGFLEALQVGATIEDLDINDIKGFYANTTIQDIIKVYDNLSCGSRNHLRSFVGQLSNFQYDYVPQYLNQEEFDSIINSSNEQCAK